MNRKFKHIKKLQYFNKLFAISFEYNTKSLSFTRTKNTWRIDHLFGLNRSYKRSHRKYVYSFHLLSFTIRFIKT